MNLNIRNWIVIILLGLTTIVQAQEDLQEKQQEDQDQPESHNSILNDDHYGIFEIGPYFPIALGENFANKGMHQEVGGQFSFMFNLSDSPLLLGMTVTSFGADNTNQNLVGYYESSNISVVSLAAGYHIIYKKHWRLTGTASIGFATYNNRSGSDRFKDSGPSLAFVPSLSYQFIKNVGVYISPSFRRDFLHIHAPEELEQFFNGASYFSVSFGLRIVI